MPSINKGKWGKYHTKENKRVFFYPNEWLKLISLCKGKQKVSFTVLINTGARVNEARHIKVSDIDFSRNNIILRVTKVRAKKKETKSEPRILPISSKFSKYLKKIIKEYKLTSDNYLPMLKNAGLNIALKKLVEQVGRKDFEDFSVHNIRKTMECYLVALDIDSLKIIKHMGHTLAVAAQSYVSPDIFTYDDKKMIREILGDLYYRGGL